MRSLPSPAVQYSPPNRRLPSLHILGDPNNTQFQAHEGGDATASNSDKGGSTKKSSAMIGQAPSADDTRGEGVPKRAVWSARVAKPPPLKPRIGRVLRLGDIGILLTLIGTKGTDELVRRAVIARIHEPTYDVGMPGTMEK